jgi:hypothetical protein
VSSQAGPAARPTDAEDKTVPMLCPARYVTRPTYVCAMCRRTSVHPVATAGDAAARLCQHFQLSLKARLQICRKDSVFSAGKEIWCLISQYRFQRLNREHDTLLSCFYCLSQTNSHSQRARTVLGHFGEEKIPLPGFKPPIVRPAAH